MENQSNLEGCVSADFFTNVIALNKQAHEVLDTLLMNVIIAGGPHAENLEKKSVAACKDLDLLKRLYNNKISTFEFIVAVGDHEVIDNLELDMEEAEELIYFVKTYAAMYCVKQYSQFIHKQMSLLRLTETVFNKIETFIQYGNTEASVEFNM